MNENAAGLGFIAYTRRYGTRAQDCKDDCHYINSLLSGNYPLNTSAPENTLAPYLVKYQNQN